MFAPRPAPATAVAYELLVALRRPLRGGCDLFRGRSCVCRGASSIDRAVCDMKCGMLRFRIHETRGHIRDCCLLAFYAHACAVHVAANCPHHRPRVYEIDPQRTQEYMPPRPPQKKKTPSRDTSQCHHAHSVRTDSSSSPHETAFTFACVTVTCMSDRFSTREGIYSWRYLDSGSIKCSLSSASRSRCNRRRRETLSGRLLDQRS